MDKKILVAYFSCTGTTKKVASDIAKATNGTLFEIKPEIPYTYADLNWMDKNARSSIEMKDPSSRPELADENADIASYDVIFLGFPIWWYVAPTIINTFLEAYDFSGKTIILFATSGGSGLGKTVEKLKPSVPDTTVIKEGKLLNGHVTKENLENWLKTFNL